MSEPSYIPEDLSIDTDTYDWCVKAFRTTKKLFKLNIKLHEHKPGAGDEEIAGDQNSAALGDVFLFNHFARFETFIPQYLIHEATGAYCRSVASSEFFREDDRFSQFLYSVGVVPNNLPDLFPFLAREILHGRKLVIFPEGGMVKDKRVVNKKGQFGIYSRMAQNRRKHHRGAAVIALALDAFKTALMRDFSKGNYARVEGWAEQLGFDSTEKLMIQAIKPTTIIPSHITFYPIRVNDNILHQAARLFNRDISKRFTEELIIEGNLLFKNTDMDIRFSKPVVAGDYWRWWEKLLLPNVVHSYNSLDELFNLKVGKGHIGGRLHTFGMQAKSAQVRDDYARSMYKAVTINLSHIAACLILYLYDDGVRRIPCSTLHKMLYIAIKNLQKTNSHLHRSLLNPEEYGNIGDKGSSRLDQFLTTVQSMELLKIEDGDYLLEEKLMEDFEIDEIRTENLISVYANEIGPLKKVTSVIKSARHEIKNMDAQKIARNRLDDQLLDWQWDREQFNKKRHQEINAQQTANLDPNWFFLESPKASASAVLLIHGFLASPAEMRRLGERLHAQGHHVLGVRLKGHGTSPWDLRSRNWQDWLASVTRGYDIIKAFSESVHIVGFSTGGLLALLQASNHADKQLKTVSCISAPMEFKNKNLKFVPLLHHANQIVRWVTSEGLMPFRSNEPEHPEVNYQHIPIRALYQLQLLVEHVKTRPVNIDAEVFLYQNTQDPVVDPASVEILQDLINADEKLVIHIDAERHGIVYENLDDIQQKICANLE